MKPDVGRASLVFGVADIRRIGEDEIEDPLLGRLQGLVKGTDSRLETIRQSKSGGIPLGQGDGCRYQVRGQHPSGFTGKSPEDRLGARPRGVIRINLFAHGRREAGDIGEDRLIGLPHPGRRSMRAIEESKQRESGTSGSRTGFEYHR